MENEKDKIKQQLLKTKQTLIKLRNTTNERKVRTFCDMENAENLQQPHLVKEHEEYLDLIEKVLGHQNRAIQKLETLETLIDSFSSKAPTQAFLEFVDIFVELQMNLKATLEDFVKAKGGGISEIFSFPWENIFGEA